MTGDCRHCKDYRECKQDCSWFHYGQIRFCPLQVLWIIEHREELASGIWPKDPYGADNNTSSRSIKTEASFVKPEITIGEVTERLKRCGTQAELLITQVEDGRTLNNLSPRAREVLMYAKGFRRKRMSFNAWKKQRKYRQNDYQAVVKATI